MRHAGRACLASSLTSSTGTPGTLTACRASTAQELRPAVGRSEHLRRRPKQTKPCCSQTRIAHRTRMLFLNEGQAGIHCSDDPRKLLFHRGRVHNANDHAVNCGPSALRDQPLGYAVILALEDPTSATSRGARHARRVHSTPDPCEHRDARDIDCVCPSGSSKIAS